MDPELTGCPGSEAELAADEQAHLAEWGDQRDVAAAEEALEVTRARVEVLRRTAEQAQAGLQSLERRIAALGARDVELAEAPRRLDAAARPLAEAREPRWNRPPARPNRPPPTPPGTPTRPSGRWRAAEQERHRSAARAEALARALQELQGSGGREVLSGDEGVVGALVELVEIDPGYESAFEAAVGASMAAVVVEGRTAAKNALGHLRSQGTSGAVLPAAGDSAGLGRHWRVCPPTSEPLRPTCGPGGGAAPLDAVLDAVLGLTVAVDGWERAIDLALDRPDLVVVTAEGRPVRPERLAGPLLVPSGHRERRRRRRRAARRSPPERRPRRPQHARGGPGGARVGPGRGAGGDPGPRPAPRRSVGRRRRAEPGVERPGTDRHRARRRPADPRRGRRVGRQRGRGPGRLRGVPSRPRGGVRGGGPAAGRRRGRTTGPRGPPAASSPTTRQQVELAAAGLAERRRVLADRLAEVERRLSGHAEEREAAAARRLRLEARRRGGRPAGRAGGRAAGSARGGRAPLSRPTTGTRSTRCGPAASDWSPCTATARVWSSAWPRCAIAPGPSTTRRPRSRSAPSR